jgi:GNAT superfamily N-acetyltransferase
VLSIRAATPADAAKVASVHIRSWQRAYRGLLPDTYLDALQPEVRMRRYRFGVQDPREPYTIVATLGGMLCGFATTGPSPDMDLADYGMLLALYVDPESWGRGVGKALMAEARCALRALGYKFAALWVLVGNERAQGFYRADGWEPDGTRRLREVWGVTVDEVRYRTSLATQG